MRYPILMLCLLLALQATCQRKKTFRRTLQMSLAPGVSTNGMHPGGYTNIISINFTSGYSAANFLVEIGALSNLNVNETRGLQFAGLFNLTGGNAYAGMQQKEIDEKKRTGFEANLSGAQFSGIGNVVLNNAFGWQTSGGVNVVKGALQGLQVAGIANVVHKYSFAVQLAGLWNVSFESMDGVQVASLANYTKGGLYGSQIGLWNTAGFIEGKNSFENDDATGLQIGLINKAGKMNGFQVGLINIGKEMQGTQIGLINIYRRGKTPVTRDGTAIGLLNFGDFGYLSVYASELFLTNIELATGNMKNGRMRSDRVNKYVHNALIYSNDARFLSSDSVRQDRWAFGYGFRKMFFNRSETPGMGEYRFISYGFDLLHVNQQHKKLTKDLSLLFRPKLMAGTKLHRKAGVYVFGAITYNVYMTDTRQEVSSTFLESSATVQGSRLQCWPGFHAGVMVH
ncbi:MAG: hypothetical protein HC848_01280 [Limnobacter sp.]|nr:hypothetical protein [Limnobacter sp.]